MSFTADPSLVAEHRQWLSGFDTQYLRNWEKLLNADSEAAMCEAEVRQLLQENGNTVEPNENLTGADQSPDFRCRQMDKTFFVEVTCISIEKATEESGLPHPFKHRGRACCYGHLNNAIFSACRRKTPQCARLNDPALVAIGTFHFQASALCFRELEVQMLLTGEEMITRNINTRTGNPVGDTYLSTKLQFATFLRPDQGTGMDHARCPISGLLLCGFGCDPREIRGLLHPLPVRAFDRALLPTVEFCRLKPGYESGQLSTEWV